MLSVFYKVDLWSFKRNFIKRGTYTVDRWQDRRSSTLIRWMCLYLPVWQAFLVNTVHIPHTPCYVVVQGAKNTWLIASVQSSVISCVVVWRLMIGESLRRRQSLMKGGMSCLSRNTHQPVNSRSHCQAAIHPRRHMKSYWDVDGFFALECPLRLLAFCKSCLRRRNYQLTSSDLLDQTTRPVFALSPSYLAIAIQVQWCRQG